MGVRITILIAAFTLLYTLLIVKLYDIQIMQGEHYGAQAVSFYRLAGILRPVRGGIYFTDKNNNLIATVINKEYPIIYADPRKVENVEKAAVVLSEITGKDSAEFVELLSKVDDPYEPILKKASNEQVEIFKSKSVPGLYIDYEKDRFYSLGDFASHLIGFVSADENIGGAYGVELYYEDTLRGRPGTVERDKIVRPAEEGGNLVLTIDRNIQAESEKILDELVAKYNAGGGTVIVGDPKTGKILTMASTPSFNPNSYSDFDIGTFLNPAVQSVYEPGSIFKIITMAAGLDSGKITPDTTYTDTGSVTLNGKTIKNWDLKSHGEVTITKVIEKSINTGAIFAETAIGHDIFYNYLLKFKFKNKTGIDLPGEVTGSLRPLEVDPRDINFATASFGQGISVTPIQLITAIAAIANRGVMMRPYINSELEPEVIGRIVSEKASHEVVEIMVNAVEKAEIPRIGGYNVAGKTGTAQVPDFERGGYTDKVINTYIGFAPAYDPRFIILIKLNKPEGAPLAGLTVVPAFRNLAQFILNYYNVPPDNI